MMKRILSNGPVMLVLRLVFGFLFLYACYDKILYPARFAVAVDNYRMLPKVLVNLMAVCLPWLELAIGLLLITGPLVEEAAFISALLCLMFLMALSQALVRGLDISCGCFVQDTGVSSKISPLLVFRDMALISGSLWIMFYNRKRSLFRLLKPWTPDHGT